MKPIRSWPATPLLLASIVFAGFTVLTPGPAAAGESILATEARATAVSAYGGRVVWSSFDRLSQMYRLVAYDAATGRRTLPVRPRRVPFDVDLGPAPGSGVSAVYSRCAIEPEIPTGRNELPTYVDGRGCDLYLYDFRASREHRIGPRSLATASEVLPSVWRGDVAFARVYERRRGIEGLRAHLYYGSLTSRQPPRRLRGGTPGHWQDVNLSGSDPDYVGGDAPVGLDLQGERLAFVWALSLKQCEPNQPADDGMAPSRSEIWTERVDGHRRLLIEYGCSGDETDYFFSPTFSGGRLFYFRRLNVTSYGGRFRAYDLVTRTFSESRAGRRAFSIARDGGMTYYSLLPRTGRIRIVRSTDLVFEPSQRSANR